VGGSDRPERASAVHSPAIRNCCPKTEAHFRELASWRYPLFATQPILSPLGSGGMGEVYKARDTRLDRIVAIKTSHAKFSECFEREARAVAALNHPHICQLYDVGPNYLVMEFIDGPPLKGPLALEEALRLAMQIADALIEAHRAGLLHRDLKPGNILVNAKGAKLVDFGLAAQIGDPDATVTMAVMGTPAYMAPEQAEAKPLDQRTDVFSFGAVLYERHCQLCSKLKD
jgi:serine/threonine protein kinase